MISCIHVLLFIRFLKSIYICYGIGPVVAYKNGPTEWSMRKPHAGGEWYISTEKDHFRDEYQFVMFDSECHHARQVVTTDTVVGLV